LELHLLHEDGASGKMHIPAAVVEVKMAVYDSAHVLHSYAELRQGRQEWTSYDLIVLIDCGVSFAQT
jgi:hypothetical protein